MRTLHPHLTPRSSPHAPLLRCPLPTRILTVAQDPALRKPLFWELAIPSPPPDPATYESDERRSLVATGFRSFDAISPHFYTAVHKFHYFGVDEIEEDSVLVHYAGVLAMHGIAFGGDSAYSQWQKRTDTKEAAYMVRPCAGRAARLRCPCLRGWLGLRHAAARSLLPAKLGPARARAMATCLILASPLLPGLSPALPTACLPRSIPPQVHKKVLQILGSKWPQPVQWLLKAPTIHSCFLDTLLKVYPDACLVVTHRRPVEVLPSWCKFVLSPMCATLWRHGTKHRFARTKALEQLELFERIEAKIAAVRETHGAQMFDVE